MEFYTNFLKSNTEIDTNTIVCFDSEVSSYWIDKQGNIIEYSPSLSDEFYNECDKGSCLYIWQCSVNDTIYYGRELEEFEEFINELQERFVKKGKKDKLYIFIHNLSYDFQFLRNLWNYNFENVFSRTLRKPMKACLNDIEFRCTYFMTNMSLATWGKQLGIHKKSGIEFNYTKLRSPITELTPLELEYCERDIEVMIVGIKKLLEEYKTIANIPLTNTGQVRRVVKNIYKKDCNYKHFITSCLPRTVDEYLIYKQVFGGGDTHGNIINVNRVLEEVGSVDECSAYIGIMFRKKFPVSRFFIVDEEDDFDFEKYSYIFLCEFTDIKLKKGITLSYISTSRTVSVSGGKYDNGRVMSADKVTMYCDEYTFQDIQRIYDGKIKILSARRARKGYLDKRYIEYMLQLFEYKTTLKGIKEKEDLYMKSKNRLNSLFGMMVCDIIQPEIIFNGDWLAHGQLEQSIEDGLQDIKKKWYNNYFSYTIGVYITALARHELWNMILRFDNNDVCYFDTDSVKFLNPHKYMKMVEKCNKEIIKESEQACKHYGFSKKVFRPLKPSGEESILGTWEFEGIYKKAKFLGAKKYCVEEDDGLHITVSGVPKRAVKSLKSIEDFSDGFCFDAESCQKGLSTYLDGTNPEVTLPDGYTVRQPFGINIRNCGYTLGITEEFEQMIAFMVEHGEI